MNRTVYILLLVFLSFIGANLLAQQKTKGKADKKTENTAAAAPRIFLPPVYLGHSNYWGGAMTKSLFDSLLKQGLTSRDSAGNQYKVIGFDFGYVERSYYEDSIGNNIMLMDFNTEHCKGDTISRDISTSIYDRTKYGDTVLFEHIKVVKLPAAETATEDNAILARSMKFFIVK